MGATTYAATDPDTANPPICELRPPSGSPNLQVILLNDVGCGASSAYGGPAIRPPSSCWPLVLQWLMNDPLFTGHQAVQRLEQEQPGLYAGSPRTLQRRMADWRIAHA